MSSVMAERPMGGSVDHQQLFVSLYDELRRLAQRKLRQGGAANSMGATTLLHEVYLTVHARDGVVFPDNARFLAYASRAMRGLIIDYARSRQALKRGAGFEITSLPTEIPEQVADSNELQRLEARRSGGSQVFRWLLVCRDRRDVEHVGAYGPAGLGKGADIPAQVFVRCGGVRLVS